MHFADTELVLKENGNVYHLNLNPENIAENIIIVGDPQRVELISNLFDKVTFKMHNREFVTHTGLYKNQPITVLGTGIGTDNIDIVINELDALVNIDLKNRTIKKEHTTLNIVRIGTCGAMQENIPVNSTIISEYGLGLDGLMHFYNIEYSETERLLTNAFINQTQFDTKITLPYFIKASDSLLNHLMTNDFYKGITTTAPGFYGPQGRELRGKLKMPDLNEKLNQFEYNNHKVLNFEMETSALYGLSKILGHNACTVCVVIGNRFSKQFSPNYKPYIEALAKHVLDRLTLLS
jgi:uridine phosphorylase